MSRNIKITKFAENDALTEHPNQTRQIRYLQRYLAELDAETVIEEPKYFDRDYLDEFSAFYSISSKPYVNTCNRLHFFSSAISRSVLRRAAGGSKNAVNAMQKSYLGFVVFRPIPAAPLGRTVLCWYPDTEEKDIQTPRVKNPSRIYSVHIAGIELIVEGLAWQQQDTGVAACATVSLWSMLHSSAFDDHHAIPTTAEITRAAHSSHSFGSRVFPSQGLNSYQICDAIKEQELAPLVTVGDVVDGEDIYGFSKERFSSTCASYIRSGYPVLLIGHFLSVDDSGHAICVVGFRSSAPKIAETQLPDLAESDIEHIYIHDDNLGPNVRFIIDTFSIVTSAALNSAEIEEAKIAEEVEVEEVKEGADETKQVEEDGSIESAGEPDDDQETTEKLDARNAVEIVVLSTSEPISKNGDSNQPSPTWDYGQFVPTQLIVAAHNNIRTSPDTLHEAGLIKAAVISLMINYIGEKFGSEENGLIVSSRFIKLASYLGEELNERLCSNRSVLGRVRLALCEKVDPMSLHIGVIRISLDNATPLLDILYDTTDSDRNHPVYCYVSYSQKLTAVVEVIKSVDRSYFISKFGEAYASANEFGKSVEAY